MNYTKSMVDPGWWDYTAIDPAVLAEAAALGVSDMEHLSRPGFQVRLYDSIEELYCATASEYIAAWKKSTPDNPCGVCGPIGPTEQLPLIAQMVNDMHISLKDAHFWGMDEWATDGKAVSPEHPLSFAQANERLCFSKIDPGLRMQPENIRYPLDHNLDAYTRSFDEITCEVMIGGQGDVKHWAFNDPYPRTGAYSETPPTAEEYLRLAARHVSLHPLTRLQNSRSATGGYPVPMPVEAFTVGPVETMKAKKVSIYHPGYHDGPFGMRLTAFMISKKIADTCVPMSLLCHHPNVVFHFYRGGLGTCDPAITRGLVNRL